MSKKMLKRSLALGALMAFVITGSAFAETHYIIKPDGSVVQVDKSTPSENASQGSQRNISGDISGWDHFEGKDILEKMYYPGSKKLEEDTEINGKINFSGNNATVSQNTEEDALPISSNPTYANTDLNGKTLTVTYKESSGAAISASGTYNNFTNDKIYIEVENNSYEWYKKGVNFSYDFQENSSLEIPGFSFTNGNLVVDSGKYGIHGYGTVDVGTLKITSVNNAIQSYKVDKNSGNLSLDIDAENIELYVGAKGNAIQVENTLNIDSDVLNITNIKDSSYGRAISVSKAVTAKIHADVMNISGATKSSKVDNNGILNVNANSGEIVNDFEAASTGTINVTFGSGVNWEGAFTTADDASGNVTLNGATWNVTGDSNVTTLAGNGGKLELSYDNDAERFVKVDIDNLTNDALVVTGGEKLTQAIESGKVSDSNEKVLEDLASAVTADEGAIAVVKIEEGDILGEVTASVGADGKVVAGSVKEAVNTVNKAIGEASVVGIAHIRAHMNDMNKRMGELRMANGEAGVWARMVRGEEEYAGAKSQYNQYQLGYDEKLSVDKRWTVGAAVTFAEGNGNFTNGSTENDSTAFAVYGSKLNNDGSFVDLIARYANFDSDITMGREKADYSTNGYSVSAEFGKRIQQGNGLWIEPQFELTYGSVDSAEYSIAGRNVQVGDMDSLIGRVGFSLGKDIKQGNVYARASYFYDFDGETETAFSNTSGFTKTIKEDLGGGWWEVGVGANINLSKATYIYADVEKTFGGEVDTNWQWNLGVRYSF